MYSVDFLNAQDKAELQRIALADFGEELKPALTQEQMINQLIKFQGGEPETGGTVPVDPSANRPEVLEEAEGASEPSEQKYKVTIFEEKGESPYVDVAVNGRALRIRRGSEVVIAERFVNVLRNSVQVIHEPTEKDGKVTMIEKSVPRFNIVAEPVK